MGEKLERFSNCRKRSWFNRQYLWCCCHWICRYNHHIRSWSSYYNWILGICWIWYIYGIGGLALYGIIFAPYIRRSGAHTLSEWLEMRFDSRTRTLVTLATILGLLGIMANNVVSMAIVTTGFTGWSLLGTLAVIFFLFLLFTYIGGFWAVTLTDFLQMCVGLIALPVLILSLVMKYGGFSFIKSEWAGTGF